MNLIPFFSSLEQEDFQQILDLNNLYDYVSVNIDQFPDFSKADIAIFGVAEERGTNSNKGTAQGIIEVRKELYKLKKGIGDYQLVDLGNLRIGKNLDETYTKISKVCNFLLQKNILPLIIGGSHDLDIGQYKAYEGLDKLVSFLNVDAFLDMEDGTLSSGSTSHIHKILLDERHYLFNYNHLAYQSYLIDYKIIDIIESLNFNAYRVGKVRSNLAEMEPVIRDADLMSFDISAIRSSDAPANNNTQPFGLSGEDACQICRYAGLNSKLSSVGFYEYNFDLDDKDKKTAKVIATMVWYFIDGFYHRKEEQSFKSNDYTKYVVTMSNGLEFINFYKSKFTDRWWMEIPKLNTNSKYQRNAIVPCSYSDYKIASKGEVPQVYINNCVRML